MTPFKLELPHAKISGVQAGSGPALVFLHAGVADKRMWTRQLGAFSSTHRVVAYDRRGFGDTQAEDAPFSQLEDLERVLGHLQLEQVTLVGCSQGGRLALDFALAHPERVNALVLISSAISGAPKPEKFSGAVAAKLENLERADEAGDLDAVNKLEAQLWLDGPEATAERVSGELRDLFLAMNGAALSQEVDGESTPPSAYNRLDKLAVPTLVLWGDLDFPHMMTNSRTLLASVPGATGEAIEGAAHLPGLEQPELVTSLIQTFLDQL